MRSISGDLYARHLKKTVWDNLEEYQQIDQMFSGGKDVLGGSQLLV